MAPKKQAVYFFALECRDKRGMRGNMRDIIEAIYPEWQAMTPLQKGPYERQAKEARENERQDGGGGGGGGKKPSHQAPPCTSIAASLGGPSLTSPSSLLGSRGDKLIDDMERLLGSSPDELIGQHWYIVKFATFCRCNINQDGYEPYFVLAELGLVEYSLLEGILNTYHTFIKPNTIPLGYLSQCMDSSRDMHHIPLDSAANEQLVAGKTYADIYQKICEFVAKKPENKNMVRLFCMAEDMEQTRFGLEYLHDQARTLGYDMPPLHDLVYDLESLVVGLARKQVSLAQAGEMLTKYSFDYSPHTKCMFHQDEGMLHCALGIVKRKAFLMSDHLCPLHGIQVTTNHLPPEAPAGTIVTDDTIDLQFRYRRTMANRRDARYRDGDDFDDAHENRPRRTGGGGYQAATACYDIRYHHHRETTLQDNNEARGRPRSNRVAVSDVFEQQQECKTTTTTTTSSMARTRIVAGRGMTSSMSALSMGVVSSMANDDYDDDTKSHATATTTTTTTTTANKDDEDGWFPVVNHNAWSKPLQSMNSAPAPPKTTTAAAAPNTFQEPVKPKAFGRGRGRCVVP